MEGLQGGITAFPVRIIPFDLGRALTEADLRRMDALIEKEYQRFEISPRQRPIMKGCDAAFRVNEHLSGYIYTNGICVMVIKEPPLDLTDEYQYFSVPYGENRKAAHDRLFHWTHPDSADIARVLQELRSLVYNNTRKKKELRKSSRADFEYQGLSYIMTLSLFSTLAEATIGTAGFKKYPRWLKNNLYALLDPSVVYLEDSGKFVPSGPDEVDSLRLLNNLEPPEDLKDHERHRHMDVYMSWAAVVLVGQIQPVDREEYITLEVQLQSDWFYVYCMEKSLDSTAVPKKQQMIELQQKSYELDLLCNRLYDFDDSSLPARILEVQKGLVETSGLATNIEHAQKRIRFILEKEKLSNELKQRKLAQSTEILLFIVAFVQIAPTVAEYGEYLFPNAGIIANVLIVLLGMLLLLLKNQ